MAILKRPFIRIAILRIKSDNETGCFFFQVQNIKNEKKGEDFGYFYGCFLRSSTVAMAMAMIIATAARAVYIIMSVVVATFDTGAAVGAGVVAGSEAWNDASAEDP